MKPRTLAIVPARGGSKRIPGKNIRPLFGVPLIAWTAAFARSLSHFTKTIISTDDPHIERIGQAAGLQSFGLRPAHLSSDIATSADVALYELTRAEAHEGNTYDMVALLQPTTPYRLTKRWNDAFDIIRRTSAPAIVGVRPVLQSPFHSFVRSQDGALSALFEDHLKSRSQDLPQTVAVNGSLYLIECSTLRQTGSFFPQQSLSVLCDTSLENIDIDTEDDWANCVWHMQQANINPPL